MNSLDTKNMIAQYDLTTLYSEEEYEADDECGYSSYDSYIENEADYMWLDFCEQVGERIRNMQGKVLVKGYNLDWRGRDGQKVVEIEIADDISNFSVGRYFMLQVARDIEFAYLYHVGKYDTKKGFTMIIPTHDCVKSFEVTRKK